MYMHVLFPFAFLFFWVVFFFRVIAGCKEDTAYPH